MKTINFRKLSLEDTLFAKGIAILLIMMHNFLHWMPPKIGENEQDFELSRVLSYISQTISHPELFIQGTIGFLGHYGVQIFLFLSAYGLVIKYSTSADIPYFKFLKERLFKLYPAFLVAIGLWFLYKGMFVGYSTLFFEAWLSIIYKITMISNFIPGELYALNGPWWFISLIFQFYLVFPFLFKAYEKYKEVGLVVISVVALLLSAFLQNFVEFKMSGTILPHIAELSLGIYFAKKGNIVISPFVLFGVLVVFIASNFVEYIWYLSYVSVALLLMYIILKIKTNKFIIYIGQISMYIFLINGFLRTPWIEFARHADKWYLTLFLCFIFMNIVIAISAGMNKLGKLIKGS